MTRFLGPLALVVVGFLALAGCGRDPRPGTAPSEPPAEVGLTVIPRGERQEAPPLAGPTLTGGAADVAALRGHPVLVNAWATWCAPCRKEIPLLVTAAEDHPDLRVVGLDVQDRPEAARAFAADMGVPYPSIVDPTGEILAGVPGVPPRALPSTVAIDREGRIAARVIGPVDRAMIEKLRAAADAR